MKRLGFTALGGEVVDGPDGIRLLGGSDPRSSGLGTRRDKPGISFEDQEQRLADLACVHDADGERINALLVHGASSAEASSTRAARPGAGRAPARAGRPDGDDRDQRQDRLLLRRRVDRRRRLRAGLGSKLRRGAQVTLVTFADGVPVGLQPVT